MTMIERQRPTPPSPEAKGTAALRELTVIKQTLDQQIAINGNALGELRRQYAEIDAQPFIDSNVQMFNERVEDVYGMSGLRDDDSPHPFLLTPQPVHWVARTMNLPGAIHGTIIPGEHEVGGSFAVFLVDTTKDEDVSIMNPMGSSSLFIPDPAKYSRDAMAIEKLRDLFEKSTQATHLINMQAIDKEIQYIFHLMSGNQIAFNGFHQHSWGNVLNQEYDAPHTSDSPVNNEQAQMRIKEAFDAFLRRRVEAVRKYILE